LKDTAFSVSYSDIIRAEKALKGIALHTSVLTSQRMNEDANAQVFFKCENFQRSGSFKFRGAYTAISSLGEVQQRLGVIANSSDNHARAVALASQILKVPAMIVLPSATHVATIAAVRECGAEVFLHEAHENQKTIIAELVDKFGWTLIPCVDHQEAVAGYGTVAKEFIEEVGALDYLFVPVKEGGLLSGSVVATSFLLPDCSVIGVKRTEKTDSAPTKSAQDIAAVSEKQVLAQMRFFAEHTDFIVEPSACLGAAAVLEGVVNVAGARVGVIISGGNIGIPPLHH
jgi:threonine dehydratase